MLQGGTELRGAVERGGETEGVGREEKRRGEIRREERWREEKNERRGEKREGDGEETLQDLPSFRGSHVHVLPSPPPGAIRACSSAAPEPGSEPARLEPT